MIGKVVSWSVSSVDLAREAQQVALWIHEANHLLSRSSLDNVLSMHERSCNDSAMRESAIIIAKGVAHLKWIESYNKNALRNPPEIWAELLKDFASYEHAPIFYKHVVDPRLRSRPDDMAWVIKKAREYPSLPLEYSFAKMLRLYLDVLLSAEDVAGQITYRTYGLTDVSDDAYWDARAKSFESVGLNLSGESFIKKVLPRVDEFIDILMEV
jgi:hypothetical protein